MRGRLAPIQPSRLHLVERLPHADEAGAAAGGIEDQVGQLPAELVGELQPHRLLSLDPIGLLQRRDVEPAALGAGLRPPAGRSPRACPRPCRPGRHRPRSRAPSARGSRQGRRRAPRSRPGRNRPQARRRRCRRSGMAIWRIPKTRAIDTATASPRALNDAVGRRPSSLTIGPGAPSRPPVAGSGTSGVAISPRLTALGIVRQRQELAIAPHAGLAGRQLVPVDGARHRVEVIAHEKRLPGRGDVLRPAGIEPLARGAAFEVAHVSGRRFRSAHDAPSHASGTPAAYAVRSLGECSQETTKG